MNNIPTMSLKEVPFQFATFTPAEYTSTYKPETVNYSLLSHAYQLQENREKEANDKMTKIDATLNQLREELNVADYDWLSGKSKEIQDRIDTQIALGNYQSAIRIANEEAKGILRDEELNNRRSANKTYEKEKQRVASMNIDPLTKRRWDAENKYSYNGTAEWEPTWDVVDDISIASLQNMAAQMTAEDAHSSNRQWSHSGETFYDEKGNAIKNVAKGIDSTKYSKTSSSGGSTGSSTHKKSKEDMTKSFKALLADSKISLSLNQKHDTLIWGYNDALKRSEDISLSEEERRVAKSEANALKNQITDKNGIIIDDYDKWLDAKVISMFENMEYYNTATTSSNHSSYNYGGGAGLSNNSKNSNNPYTDVTETTTVKGSVVESTEQVTSGTQYKVEWFTPLLPPPNNNQQQKQQ